ncbi:hypothetical protein N9Z01_07015, partial [Flavobacteriaceae bacterium]|nr:hypothetical protein [Flavobacteriaceae bacterium]
VLINNKSIKMKKLLLLLYAIVFSTSIFAQRLNRATEISVDGPNRGAVLDLMDDFYGTVKYNEGSGVVIQWIRMGIDESTHRVINYGDANNFGVLAGERKEYQGPAFWSRLSRHVSYNRASASVNIEVLSPNNQNHNFSQNWDLKIKDPEKYINAFRTLVTELKNEIGQRRIAFGAHTINGYGGGDSLYYSWRLKLARNRNNKS